MSEIQLPNPHLSSLDEDSTFHLGVPLTKDSAKVFSNVKFVCIGGTRSRMRAACVHMAREIYHQELDADDKFDHLFENDRYSGYLTGHILCVSHGMGTPSVSIMLHEVFKLLSCAGCSDVTVIRIGTCGGIGVPGGTVVITEEALTVDLKPVYNSSSFGRPLPLPVNVDKALIKDIQTVAHSHNTTKSFDVVIAKTYCADDFYQGQGRIDGSFCDKTDEDKKAFLTQLYDAGVRNIEMESAAVLALSHRVGIKAAVMCVTLVDRMVTDRPVLTPAQHKDWINRPICLLTEYIKSKLHHQQQ